ncbi:MAG: alkaline phosphatase family protein, partial [Planctomycetes bacterium]|nr:alkaline phosphatase family protein [Planctomycetota bacterium]
GSQRPTLTLVYLPHRDYDLQRFGPVFSGLDGALGEVDKVVGDIITAARARDMEGVVLSEYGITEVSSSVPINRALRETGLLKVHRAGNGELLDPGASEAFALSDHQVAHVYVRREENRASVKRLVEELPGVEEVLDEDGKRIHGLDHARSGDLVAVA